MMYGSFDGSVYASDPNAEVGILVHMIHACERDRDVHSGILENFQYIPWQV